MEGFAEQLLELKGQDLIGVPLKVSAHASSSPESAHSALSIHTVSKQQQAEHAPSFTASPTAAVTGMLETERGTMIGTYRKRCNLHFAVQFDFTSLTTAPRNASRSRSLEALQHCCLHSA